MKLLYFCPATIGGVARNALEQSLALSAQGVEVDLCIPPNFDVWKGTEGLSVRPILQCGPHGKQRSRLLSRISLARAILGNHKALYNAVLTGGHTHVLMASYSEYLAPLWAGSLRRLSKRGVVFGANALDPVRNYVVGPRWWHEWSVREGFSYLDFAFVYTAIDLAEASGNPKMETVLIPHGPYDFPALRQTKDAIRDDLGIPRDAFLLLSFGHLREYKNLALVLEALAHYPQIHLLVAGTEAVAGQKSSREYRAIAEKWGVANRVHWNIGYIPDHEVAHIFHCADALILTYSEKFRSGSGILYTAASMRKPMIVSAGESALCHLVDKYELGVRVLPDSVSEIRRGIHLLLNSESAARWDDFIQHESYEKAAEIIVEKMYKNIKK